MEFDYEKQITAPKYTTDERVGLSTVTGSMIFNTTTIKCNVMMVQIGMIYSKYLKNND